MSQPLRVLHLVDSLNLGGIQTLLRDVLPALAARGLDVRLVALHGPGPFTKAFTMRGIDPVHLAPARLDPRMPYRLWRLLRDNPVDILHTHGVPSCWLGEGALALGVVPRLVQHVHHMYQGQHGQALQNACERFVYRRGHALVACSRAVADSIDSPLPKRVIYNGVDTTHFAPPRPAERQAARHRFGFTAEDHVLCMTGRITRDKGVLALCKTLRHLVDDGSPQLKLLVAGAGPDAEEVRAYCDGAGLAGRVNLAGFQEDVRPCLHAADTYVMASRSEGLGTALLEAMASGAPAIVADYPAAREIVDDGVHGRLFSLAVEGALADAVRERVANEEQARAQAERARSRVETAFSLSATAEGLAGLYGDIIRGR